MDIDIVTVTHSTTYSNIAKNISYYSWWFTPKINNIACSAILKLSLSDIS